MTFWKSRTEAPLPPLIDEVRQYPEVEYADTAHKGPLPTYGTRSDYKAPAAYLRLGKRLRDNTRCHEYITLDVGQWQSPDSMRELMLTPQKKYDRRGRIKMEAQADAQMPAAYNDYQLALAASFWLQMFIPMVYICIVFSVITMVAGPFVFGVESVYEFFQSIAVSGLITLAFFALYYLLKFLHEKEIVARFDKAPNVRFTMRRDTGMVTFRSFFGRKLITVPFSEIEARVQHAPPAPGSIGYIALCLRHKYSQHRFTINGFGGGFHPNQLFTLYVEWEQWQQFMDVTRPLPDIPSYEPYRHLDPTTREWDKQHNRPKDLWLNMDQETYEAMSRAATAAARAYPFDDPDRDKNWQPAGDGQHWYQLG